MLLILDSLLANAGHVNASDFAKRLRFWVDHVRFTFCNDDRNNNYIYQGYSELGDLAGLGIGLTVKVPSQCFFFIALN